MGIGCENCTKHISAICTSRRSSVVVMNGLVSWTTRVWIPHRNKRKVQTHSGAPHKFHWLPDFFPLGRRGGGAVWNPMTHLHLLLGSDRLVIYLIYLTLPIHCVVCLTTTSLPVLRATSPDTALYCFLLQIPVSSLFIKAISLAPCDLFLVSSFHTS
jgi:hypothetical protein